MELDKIDTSKSKMQSVKQRFFALRNGVVADMLRKAGSPYRIIFGLNLPQLQQLAAVFGKDEELADLLWNDKSVRESRLLAPMLLDASALSPAKASAWLNDLTGSTEELDLLCHSLLRKVDFAEELFDTLCHDDEPLRRYVALRLGFALMNRCPEKIRDFAIKEKEKNNPVTLNVARQLSAEFE